MSVRLPPLITLLTDFGTADHYVGAMKGLIASIAPAVRVIDISHEVEAYQIAQARFLLAQSWPWFPPKTIHIAVVDPGVGSERRPIVVEAAQHLFIGPDNGIFSDLLALPKVKVRHLKNPKYRLNHTSSTFHGRDIFAPAAAHLGKGVKPGLLGPLIEDALRDNLTGPQRIGKRTWSGAVVHVDRFGNLITNLPAKDFPQTGRGRFVLRIGMTVVSELAPFYASIPPGTHQAIVGSSGNLEVAANQDSAARRLGCGIGTPVEIDVW